MLVLVAHLGPERQERERSSLVLLHAVTAAGAASSPSLFHEKQPKTRIPKFAGTHTHISHVSLISFPTSFPFVFSHVSWPSAGFRIKRRDRILNVNHSISSLLPTPLTSEVKNVFVTKSWITLKSESNEANLMKCKGSKEPSLVLFHSLTFQAYLDFVFILSFCQQGRRSQRCHMHTFPDLVRLSSACLHSFFKPLSPYPAKETEFFTRLMLSMEVLYSLT